MIDGAAQAHVDLNVITAPVNPSHVTLAPEHATHVAGILGARSNNIAVRGVNPGALIVNVFRGNTFAEINAALDWVLADAEQNGIYAVANLSSSGSDWVEGAASQHAKYVRRISNRVLFVMSAGNYRVSTCGAAYSRTLPSDGILVVGGIDENNGEAIGYDNTHIPGMIFQRGSNLGLCNEVWGPSQRVWSTWTASTVSSQRLSGTSMAAPYVSGLAARYGSDATTPVEREQWIRAKTFFAGYDSDGAPIFVPSYTQPPSSSLNGRLFPASVTADATHPGTSLAYLSDSVYLTGVWNAGHLAPAWVEFDLGSHRVITSIRLVPEQFPAGPVTHYIYAGSSPAPTGLVATISAQSDNLEPMSGLIGTYARYLRVFTASSPSWVAFREIEIYGY